MSPQSPDTTVTTGTIEDGKLDKESVIEFLGEDNQEPETLELEESKKKDSKDTKEEKPTKEAKESGDEVDDEEELSLEDELEEELTEPDTEDEVDLVAPPARREILAKYPQLFKDFPHIERAVYREQKYAEMLPTLEDAKNAVDKASMLDKYEAEVVKGSTESFLATIRDNDRDSFAKIVDNYLPTLYQVDQSAYFHTIGNVIKHTILSMVRDSKESNDEELGTAAAILNKFIFGTEQFTHPTRLSKDSVQDPQAKQKEDEISEREKEFLNRKFTTARDDLGSRVDNIVKSTVDKAIDPKSSMTDKVRASAVREVMEGLESAIQRDTRFRAVFDKLWEKAFTNDFDAESMDRIKKAYLSKAKTLLPHLIKKSRNEFLRGNARSNDNDNKDKKGHLPVGKNRSSTTLTSGRANNGNTAKQGIPKGMTTLEFLNSDD